MENLSYKMIKRFPKCKLRQLRETIILSNFPVQRITSAYGSIIEIEK
jgi:hypothetical protein